MKISIPQLRAGVFGFTLLMFLFPFLTISCPGGHVTLSGVQLAVGTNIEQPQIFGPPEVRPIRAEPLAFLAVICVLAGIAAAFVKGGPGRALAAAAGLLGAVLLLALKSKIDGEASRQGMGILEIRFGLGYWGAVLGCAAGFLSSILVKPSGKTPVDPESAPPET